MSTTAFKLHSVKGLKPFATNAFVPCWRFNAAQNDLSCGLFWSLKPQLSIGLKDHGVITAVSVSSSSSLVYRVESTSTVKVSDVGKTAK